MKRESKKKKGRGEKDKTSAGKTVAGPREKYKGISGGEKKSIANATTAAPRSRWTKNQREEPGPPSDEYGTGACQKQKTHSSPRRRDRCTRNPTEERKRKNATA